MAQLKDTVVSGSLRATDTIYTDTIQLTKILAPSSSNGTTYTAGSNGYVLKSNGTSMYWASDNNTTALTSMTGTLGIDHGGTGAVTAENAAWNILRSDDPGNLNTAKRLGIFKISNTTTNTPASSMWGVALNITDDLAAGNNGANGSTYQLVFKTASTDMWLRTITNAASWSDYAKIYTDKNFNGSSEKLTDVALTWSGSYTTGSWMLIYNNENGTNGGKLFRGINQTNTAAWVDGAHKWVRIGGDTMTGTLNTQLLRPDGNWTRELGDGSHYWKRAWIGTNGGLINIGDIGISHQYYASDNYVTTDTSKGYLVFDRYNAAIGSPLANKFYGICREAVTLRYTRNGGTNWTVWTNADTSTYYTDMRVVDTFGLASNMLVGGAAKTDSGTNGTPQAYSEVGCGVQIEIDFGVENRTGYIDYLTTYLYSYCRTCSFTIESYRAKDNSWETIHENTITNTERFEQVYLKTGLYIEGRQDRTTVGGRRSTQKLRYTFMVTAQDASGNNLRLTPRMGMFSGYGYGGANLTTGLQVNINNTSGTAEQRDITKSSYFSYTMSRWGTPYQITSNGVNNGRGQLKISTSEVEITDLYRINDANTNSYCVLTIGNSNPKSTQSAHEEGILRIYSSTAYRHEISGGAATATRYHTFPDISGYIVSTNTTSAAVGDAYNKPVYIDSSGIAQTATVVAHRGNAGKSNMNDVAKLWPSVGMTSLTSTNNADTPKNGSTYTSSWHLFWDVSYADDPSSTNAWVAQIVNRAGTSQWWVRSRSGGTITNGTAWGSSWRHLVTSTEAAQGNSTKNIYVNDNGEIQEGSVYAGGTAVTLNGSGKGGTTASFYAPTGAGTANQLLKSTASTPEWTSSIVLGTSGNAINITASGTNTVTLTATSTGGWLWS